MKAKVTIPPRMRALVLSAYGEAPQLTVRDTPLPGKGEILVQIDSSPLNPSDHTFLRGLYASPKTLPVIPGFEGSGTVVATGNDLMSRRLLGKKVACFAPLDGDGTWAEYMITQNTLAIPLQKDTDLEAASMFMVNPLTAIAMTEIARKEKTAIANTAAAGALGQILNRMCIQKGITLVNIVRSEAQVEQMKAKGAQYVLNSTAENFKEDLAGMLSELNVRVLFEAVCGDLTHDLLEAMPKKGSIYIYGALTEKDIQADPREFIFKQKSIRGFWLTQWINRQSILRLLGYFKQVERFIRETHQTTIAQRVGLGDVYECIPSYMADMSGGKLLVKPGMDND